MTRSDPRRDDWVDRARKADLLETAHRFGATLKRNGREHTGPCPFCGGKDRFSINPAKQKWNCRGARGGGDAIGMVEHIGNLSFAEAVQDITGEPPPNGLARPLSDVEKLERQRRRAAAEADQRAREADHKAYQEDTKEAAQAIWSGSVLNQGDAVMAYLASRGFAGVADPALRAHRGLRYPNGKVYPALVCRVDDAFGDLCAVWRIFLREDGRKADVETAKLGLGPAGGGAVRIGGTGSKIGIAEGIESALGAWHLIGRKHPVWSVLSTAGMVGFEVPLGVDHVVIFPDGDRPIKKRGHQFEAAVPAGRQAARLLRERLLAEGIGVTIAAEPPPGKDYNDLWLQAVREDA